MTNPTNRTQATRIYHALTNAPFNMTHWQAAWLMKMFFAELPGVDGTLWREASKDREYWRLASEIVAAMAMRRDPVHAGKVILNEVWSRYPEGIPEASFTTAKSAVKMVAEAMEFNTQQKRKCLQIVEPILRWERKQAELMWDDRMIASWLKVKKLRE